MYRNFHAGIIRFLFPFIFLFYFITPVLSSSLQVAGKANVQAKDTTKEQKKDTAKIQGKDTIKVQGIDTTKAPGRDTTKIQKKDSLNLQAKDTVKHQLPDSIIYKRTDFSAEDLIRGERLFYGLVYFGDKSINCASCHNTNVSDTLNWNPDALEISGKVS